MAKFIIVSNRLPVSIQKKQNNFHFVSSAGGLATGLSSVYLNYPSVWVGWPGLEVGSSKDRQQITGELESRKMRPVFLSQKIINRFYGGFSNNIIWPLFHYYPWLVQTNEGDWEAYVQANQMFCKEVLAIAEPGDTVWVHDYHLFLLPMMLREKMPGLAIGFFQHIPFPSYEIFRILPWREQLLKGILGSDLVGFHTFDDMRHFLSSTERITGYSHTNGCVEMGEYNVQVDAFPMGIDYNRFADLARSAAVTKAVAEMRQTLGQRKLILSVDRLDFTKGIPEKLLAFEKLLNDHPEYRGNCTMILIVVPSRTQVEMYKNLKLRIEQKVGRINGQFGRIDWTPIQYMYRSVPAEQLSVFYTAADVALITPLRDGMNLVAKEFVASKEEGCGVLVLSEMAGSARELSSSLVLNPNNQEELVQTLRTAFAMPEDEQRQRLRGMQDRLKRNDVTKWCSRFLNRLGELYSTRIKLGSNSGKFNSPDELVEKVNSGNRRILFLDYDGTLVRFFNDPKQARPDKQLLEIISRLKDDENNKVVLISGRDHQTLEEWFGTLGLDIISEHGVWTKEADGEWVVNPAVSADWKEYFRPIFEDFVDRTPGTFIEEKDHSLVWHYRTADAEFGRMRARELVSNLGYLAANQDLQILEGKKVVELKHASVNKGLAAAAWLQKGDFDTILAIGDDYTDEDLFRCLPSDAITVKVGTDVTEARYRLESYKEVRALLRILGENVECEALVDLNNDSLV